MLGWVARANGHAWLGNALALGALAIALWLVLVRRRIAVALATLFAVIVVALVFVRFVAPVYWPPIAWNLGASACFLASLRRDESLIETFARMAGEERSESRRIYCRRLTLVWALWLALLGTVGLAIALTGNERLGAWWAATIDYALVGALFAGEYLWRKFRRGASQGLVAQIMTARRGFGGTGDE